MPRLPSIQALRAIESFSRHGTVWQAAEELHLTRSAVSHQLRLLERDLGFPLLDRVGTRVELTPRGRAFAEDVRRALAALSASATRHAGTGIGGSIVVSCPPGFASSWLCPSLGDFCETYPDVAVSIATPRRLDDTSNPDVDVFVTFGHEIRQGMEVELLQELAFTPLCSPAYLNQHDGFPTPESVLRARLLHISDHEDWERWLRKIGLPAENARRGVVFSDMNLVFAAAHASQGIAIGDQFICKRAMDAGQLVRPFDISVPSEKAYYLSTPVEKLDNPTVAAFHNWLKDVMHKDAAP